MAQEGFRPDISRAGKNGQDTEYGGNPGGRPGRGTSPQRLPDGTSKGLRVGESARVLRQTGMHGSTLGAEGRTAAEALAGLEPGTLEYAQELEKQAARKKLEQDTNGYWREVGDDDNVQDA